MIAALTGFMGCGKSSTALCLASTGRWAVFDLDNEIVSAEGCGIPELFSRKTGMEGFRELETKHLDRILHSHPSNGPHTLISLGGGTIMNPACLTLLKDSGAIIIYLRASVHTIVNNLHNTGYSKRPLLKDCRTNDDLTERVGKLLEERVEVYEKNADIILDIDGLSTPQIAQGIEICLDRM